MVSVTNFLSDSERSFGQAESESPGAQLQSKVNDIQIRNASEENRLLLGFLDESVATSRSSCPI
jgi:hypothetical protein